MTKAQKTAITPTREDNFALWYQEVLKAADLAENSVVRGCMVIKPWGYALWERIQQRLDKAIKDTGHSNFYFPLFVPLSFMEKEAAHVDGFAKECAVVTHHRLKATDDGTLVPDSPLEEPLIVRPTSEALIGEAYARWIQSYRDLPLLYNQWANVVRWEMRPRVFLRTSEFLWQEGHTAHATREEAIEETEKMLEVYRALCEDFLAMPMITGRKTAGERFPGADDTYTIEGMMQDGKALQAGTSHFLGQNFAKAFNIQYLSKEGTQEHVWTSSWGVTTRLIGGLIMMHADDNGLVLPAKLAPSQVVILPLEQKSADSERLHCFCAELAKKISRCTYDNESVRVHIDTKDKRPGEKMWGWIKKGAPLILEIGDKELEAGSISLYQRTQHEGGKTTVSTDHFLAQLGTFLENAQAFCLSKAHAERTARMHQADDKEAFYDLFKKKNSFVLAYWSGDTKTEDTLKKDLQVTARCVPLSSADETGRCIFTGKDKAPLTLFARAY